MGVTHIPIAEAERDLAGLLERAEHGEQIAIDSGSCSFAIQPVGKDRSVEASLRRAIAYESRFVEPPYMDEDFARDMEEIIAMRKPRKSLYDDEVDQ